MKLSIYNCIGKGYTNGWWTNCHCRYRAYKGARNSKKSVDIIGYEILHKILVQPLRNVLVIRNTFSSHRQSTFALLQRLINQPVFENYDISLSKYFKINRSEMTITYIPTGQMIIFKGMDDPQKIQSITVVNGFLTDVYIEEAFELDSYDEFRKVDGSIRGKLPDGYFHQITFLFNAWNGDHWLNDKFFKGRLEDDVEYLLTHDYKDYKDEEYIGDYGKGLYLHTSTYKINEFRDKETYDVSMEQLRLLAWEIYKVEALGCWGLTTGATYPEFNDSLILPPNQVNNIAYSCYSIGIDTGLSNGEGIVKHGKDVRVRSATTMQLVGLTADFGKLICVDEYFHTNDNLQVPKTEPQIMNEIVDTIIKWKEMYKGHPQLMKGMIPVYVDCADIGFRQGLELVAKSKGLFNITFMASTKIRIQTRVDFIRLIMAWGEFLISSNCHNLIREIRNSRKGEKGEPREDFDDHCINANEYAWQPVINRLKRWKDFKQH